MIYRYQNNEWIRLSMLHLHSCQFPDECNQFVCHYPIVYQNFRHHPIVHAVTTQFIHFVLPAWALLECFLSLTLTHFTIFLLILTLFFLLLRCLAPPNFNLYEYNITIYIYIYVVGTVRTCVCVLFFFYCWLIGWWFVDSNIAWLHSTAVYWQLMGLLQIFWAFVESIFSHSFSLNIYQSPFNLFLFAHLFTCEFFLSSALYWTFLWS